MKENIQKFWESYKGEIICGLLVFGASFSVLFWSDMRFPNDDQFILYRYIENIARGNGFVYNIGEKVLGATTPLFTLVSALFVYLLPQFSVPDIVGVLNLTFLAIGGVFFFKVLKNFVSTNLSIIAVAVFSLNLSRVMSESMETSLFIMLAFAFLHYLFSGRNYTSAVFLAFCVLTRPDASIIGIFAFLYWFRKYGWEKALKFTSAAVLVALPWFIFATFYFGSIIPQSLIAKTHTSDIVNQSSYQALKVQLSSLSRIYWGRVFDPENISLQVVFNLFPFLVLVAFAVFKKLNKDNWVVFAIPFAYLASFSISNPIMFPWYVSQMEPFWILLSVIGFSVLFEKTRNYYAKSFLILLLLIGPATFWFGRVVTEDKGSKLPLFQIGTYLKENALPGERVGVNNIGIIGYTSKLYIVDLFGLTNDYAPSFYPLSPECRDKSIQYQIPLDLLKFAKPEWLVASGESELTPCVKSSEWFQENYSLVYKKGGLIYKLNQ